MWLEFGRAFCLMLIFEGVLPFLYPGRWRRMVGVIAQMSDRDLRVMGMVSMALGVAVLFLIH